VPLATRAYEREEIEFSRVLAFSDGIFTIAMTLLVVGIGVPTVREAQLGNALRDLQYEIVSFFISFVVIGFFWLAHHRFVSTLARITSVLMMLNLLYLATIAFMPFPTALVGKYNDSPITVVIYAVTLACASLLEAIMFAVACRSNATRVPVPDDIFRFDVVSSLLPVLVFIGSIPIALISPTWALLSWLLLLPAERALDHWKPTGRDDLFR
jgi:uncharacterized membrane protein